MPLLHRQNSASASVLFLFDFRTCKQGAARKQEANGEHVREQERSVARINTETRRNCTRKCATHSPGHGGRAHRGLN